MLYATANAVSVLGITLAIPVLLLLVEVAAAVSFGVKTSAKSRALQVHRCIAVVVPAHNEGEGIVPTIKDILPQLQGHDRLIVIADNCVDDTATVAAQAGAEVIVRDDPSRVGKGYALAWAINHLEPEPPDLVLFIDADCRVQAGTIAELGEASDRFNRPIQAYFSMKSPQNTSIDHSFAEFAWLLKNWVRPLGLLNLSCPVQLTGTGMMFPWELIKSAPLASGNLVEDLKLGLDLAASGKAPRFLPSAVVTSEFPSSATGTDSQRQRWVQGHLGMMSRTPWLLGQVLLRRNWDLLVLTLDLVVPPLSLLGLLVVGFLPLAALASLFGGSAWPVLIAIVNLLGFSLALLLAWLRFGRDVLPARTVSGLGLQLANKLSLYGKILTGRTAKVWIRTDRSGHD
jgi:cellulose synthase/poly-beta-1,6-N-acetylglucosamine synthase-like glycosyltransferase